jgi:hypothetical protein
MCGTVIQTEEQREAMARRREILRQATISEEDEAELDRLQEAMGEWPIRGHTEWDRDAKQAIREYADLLREQEGEETMKGFIQKIREKREALHEETPKEPETKLEEIQRKMEEEPKWRLDLSFVRNIFDVSLEEAEEAMETLKEQGVVTELVHIRCADCDTGLKFMPPEDAENWQEECDICMFERVAHMDSGGYTYRTVYTTGPELVNC